MAPPIKNARDVLHGWGVNSGYSSISNGSNTNSTAGMLKYLKQTWVRSQVDGDVTQALQNLQNDLVTAGHPDPNLRLNLLLNGYVQNASANPWTSQSGWITNGIAKINGNNGQQVLKAIEGPNEMNSQYTGGGCRAPNGTTLIGSGATDGSDSASNANLVDWASVVKTMKNNNSSLLANVELCSGTILNYTAANWPSNLNVSQYCDYGTIHYYAGINGTNGCPSFPSNPDNFAFYYDFAKAGFGTSQLIHTEGGYSMQLSTNNGGILVDTQHNNNGYGQDGRSAARYVLMQIFDHHAKGGHRFHIYNLQNNSGSYQGHITNYNEDNFGLFYPDFSPKPPATVLGNLQTLLSLNNNYSDGSNLTDTASFSPVYTGTNLSIANMTDVGSAGNLLVMPKSDGSTMIAVWNEPTIDQATSTSTSVSANSVTVSFGSSMAYKLWDITGGGNVDQFVASTSPTTFGSGTASTVTFNLYGTPVLIELTGSTVTSAPAQPTGVSMSNTTSTRSTINWTQTVTTS